MGVRKRVARIATCAASADGGVTVGLTCGHFYVDPAPGGIMFYRYCPRCGAEIYGAGEDASVPHGWSVENDEEEEDW